MWWEKHANTHCRSLSLSLSCTHTHIHTSPHPVLHSPTCLTHAPPTIPLSVGDSSAMSTLHRAPPNTCARDTPAFDQPSTPISFTLLSARGGVACSCTHTFSHTFRRPMFAVDGNVRGVVSRIDIVFVHKVSMVWCSTLVADFHTSAPRPLLPISGRL